MYSSGISVLKYQHFIITTDNLIQERSHLFPPPAFTFQTAVSGTKRSLTECSAQRDLMSADKPPHSPPPPSPHLLIKKRTFLVQTVSGVREPLHVAGISGRKKNK